ncbi:MAG: hypothetical protein WDZ65_02875, partial [Aquisalimonadaceae bacterium]
MRRLTGFFRSSSIRTAVAFAFGGVGFALANLLLARFMTPVDYGLLTLLLALIQLGLGVGPAGVELVINRHLLPPSYCLAVRVAITGSLAALGVCAVAQFVYEVPAGVLPWLFLALAASAMSRVGSALFQSDQRFGPALGLTQVHNYLLLLAVPVAVVLDAVNATFFLIVVAVGYVATSLIGWAAARQVISSTRTPVSERTLLREGLGGLGIGVAVLVLAQAERFAIPVLLSLEEMATFGVLAAVVAAPFRMMQMAVGFTMLPRLRKAVSRAEAGRLLRAEFTIAVVVCILGTVIVLGLGPWLIRLFVGDKYDITLTLFIAAILVGYLKIAQALAVATVNALGNVVALNVMNVCCWISLAVAALGAWALSGYGLVGLVYGVGLGWLWQAIVAAWLARQA